MPEPGCDVYYSPSRLCDFDLDHADAHRSGSICWSRALDEYDIGRPYFGPRCPFCKCQPGSFMESDHWPSCVTTQPSLTVEEDHDRTA